MFLSVQYVQDYKKPSYDKEKFKNIFVTPDESFEVDVDNNFEDAW